MSKRTLALAVSLTALILTSAASASAKHSPRPPAIPERDGTYRDPDHPALRVRVFVHRPRPTKTEAPALICDLPDPDSEAFVNAAHWRLPASWTYNLNPKSAPSTVGSANVPAIASNSFSRWAAAANNRITFSAGDDTGVARQAYDSRNVIAWGRTPGTALGVTYIRYTAATGQVVDVDTILNKRLRWQWSNSTSCADPAAYDTENILTHELGHWLGLDDEYDTSYRENTMYGYGAKGEVKKNTLTSGDIAGTAAIYP